MLTIDLDDEIIEPTKPTPADAEPEHERHTPAPLVPGSITAQALLAVWKGTPVVIVDSPPGAGKSTLVANLVAQLNARSDLRVTVATFTKRQAYDIGLRIAEQVPDGRVNLAVKDIADTFAIPPHVRHSGTASSGKLTKGTVNIRTISSCTYSAPETDVLIIDEAYQVTFAQALTAADSATQVLMVGDPGQIGPVVTVNTSTWDRSLVAPHRPAPEGFAQRKDAAVLNLDSTYRLGQPTVDAIAPIYDFEFVSARPERRIAGRNELESVRIAATDSPYDMMMLTQVANLAAGMIGGDLVEDDEDGSSTVRTITAEDVAVVVSHNSQVSGVAGVLDGLGYEGVTVGTADKLQGGQWHCVVALDPFTGHEGLSPHALALGRLCVMASRHRTHLTWVHDGCWTEKLAATDIPKDQIRRHLDVRAALCTN